MTTEPSVLDDVDLAKRWHVYVHQTEKNVWRLYTRGTLEEALIDIIDFRNGQMGSDVDAIRLEVARP